MVTFPSHLYVVRKFHLEARSSVFLHDSKFLVLMLIFPLTVNSPKKGFPQKHGGGTSLPQQKLDCVERLKPMKYLCRSSRGLWKEAVWEAGRRRPWCEQRASVSYGQLATCSPAQSLQCCKPSSCHLSFPFIPTPPLKTSSGHQLSC